ncbi:MAG: FHA domain-containing protein [Prevotellaceae bacterium]|jgi:hypothetical protein|nr:FHA domain-containing protein [Prevotellaceae bacterium]
MKCKNCGWDTPGNNTKCEKCNAPLTGSMIESGNSGQSESQSEGFNPKKTATGCPECGYPLRAGIDVCPACGHELRQPAESQPAESQPAGNAGNAGNINYKPAKNNNFGGTVIQSTSLGKTNMTPTDKKLVGFLVTYSRLPNGEAFPVYEGRNYIGRSESSNICIQGDTKISGKHVAVVYRAIDRKFKFRDEQSSNGTFINEVLTDEGELNNGDIIGIGSTKLIFMVIPLI